MHRIAAAMRAVAAAPGREAGCLHRAAERESHVRPAATAEIVQPSLSHNAKLLSLLMVLEAMRQVPAPGEAVRT